MNNNIFFELFNSNAIINNIRQKVNLFYTSNEEIVQFSKKINEFIKKNNIDINLISEEIVFQHWVSLLNIILHKESKSNWSSETVHNYIICIIRLQELLIYLCTIENKEITDIFIDEKNKLQDSYYFHIKNNINSRSKEKYFHIKKVNKINKIILGYDENNNYLNTKYSYFSTINVQPFKSESISILDHYFKLDDHYVEEIFNLASSNNIIQGRNSTGQFGTRIPFEIYENFELTRIENEIENKEISEESKKEYKLKINKIQSVIFNKNNSNLVNEEFYDLALNNDLSSKYKRFKISKAISNSITKRNLDLQSDYNLPEFETFKEFFLNNKSNNICFKIIELSFFTAIEIKKLILVLLGFDTQISYKSKKSLLEISINKKIFTSALVDEELSKNTKEQKCQINLPHDISILWADSSNQLKEIFYKKYTNKEWLENIKNNQDSNENEESDYNSKIINNLEYFYEFIEAYKNDYKSDFREFISIFKKDHSSDQIKQVEKLSIVDTFLEEFYKKIDDYLKLQLKNNKKRIILSLTSINKLFLHYYKKYNNYSELNLLYTQSISKNDEARLCYNTTRDRLINFENAMNELYNKIYDKNHDSLLKEISENFWVGSPYFIKPGSFKKFIFEITKIKSNDIIEILNLNMIFIRYGLSILLGTRDFHNSSNLTEYSKELKILLIQEKAKNLYSSKRIIPLSDLALKLINIFNKIKSEYNITSNYPILLSKNKENFNENKYDENKLSKKNLKIFLDSLDRSLYEESIKYIEYFINNTKLNFGRHVITSYLSSSSLQSNYLDAFLNHFKMGKEDQGIFSNFYNLDYIESIISKLNEVSSLYFPNYIKIGAYEYKQ